MQVSFFEPGMESVGVIKGQRVCGNRGFEVIRVGMGRSVYNVFPDF